MHNDSVHSRKSIKVLVVVGPTASGKSALAVELARRFNGEIISADSRQVYRGLDIGTGKITEREMRGIPHHLLDIVSPKRVFTAHDFLTRGRKVLCDIAGRGKLPIIAGGTGFYIDALLGRIALPDTPANQGLRAALKDVGERELFSMLEELDPRRAESIDRHNKRRLIRALEIAHAPGGSARASKGAARPPAYDTLWIGLALDTKARRERIARRLKARLRQGMVAEARRLHASGLSYKRMDALGLEYRALARYLQGKVSRKDLESQLHRDICRYAKRQVTYWRRNNEIRWFAPSQMRKTMRTIRDWLS
ncbi:tRNA (adenosine(37)-N6)-dimethylallyltransferase MiaA [Candidatus Kaiserbacteria bacterium CG10_big_fil_rev_8_21_14_0_10_59_10]|uniref:tRNA dimethylallyltransferase n=1 Tax=Candidatus Kaiserbacteria bacterium CG10_big_fil_rev_8_21_14_0_10_59_10 TaxID=1974612 RepID=A0A2H0U6W1_9BACT|nr:MAG: tRNA (adenosine(37)-N6)-dimethylallyltransferase MiaA [Candidatus Kaiserbacteria bacterium CG10_big_fil_rev_8_21_14_0_10_59_10]